MRLLATTALLSALTLVPVLAGGEGWTHDFEAAKKQAAAEDKDLLIDFTGSDWCGWCIKLNDEVFQHDAFKTGVKDDFVLVELDFPQDASKLSDETKEQNSKLQEDYSVQGFPTILLTDAEGKPYARTGYQEGGPESYVTHLEKLQEAKSTRDEALAAAQSAEGVAKAEKLISALQAMGLEDAAVANFYGDVVEEIKAADPEDETGFVKELEMKAQFADFQSKLSQFGHASDHDGAFALVEETLAGETFDGEIKQQITMIKAMILAQKNDIDGAQKALDEAKAVAPDSDVAARIDGFKQQLEMMRAQATAAAEPSPAPAAEDASDEAEEAAE